MLSDEPSNKPYPFSFIAIHHHSRFLLSVSLNKLFRPSGIASRIALLEVFYGCGIIHRERITILVSRCE